MHHLDAPYTNTSCMSPPTRHKSIEVGLTCKQMTCILRYCLTRADFGLALYLLRCHRLAKRRVAFLAVYTVKHGLRNWIKRLESQRQSTRKNASPCKAVAVTDGDPYKQRWNLGSGGPERLGRFDIANLTVV